MAHNYDNDNGEREIISFCKRMHCGGENQKDNDKDALGSKFAYLINITEIVRISNKFENFAFAIKDGYLFANIILKIHLLSLILNKR